MRFGLGEICAVWVGWGHDMARIVERWAEMRLDWRAKFRWLGGFNMLHVCAVSQATNYITQAC
jgi:hypothetical protein